MPACGMSTHIVQSAYQKCKEMHDFVGLEGGPQDPPPPFHLYFIV